MRVFILEDCEIFRLSLMLVLGRESDIEIAGAAGSNSGDICKQILASQCDVLLIGLRLRNRSGLDIARELKALNPTIPILGLGFSTDAVHKSEMQTSGINVFIPLTSSNDFITSKVRNARESLKQCDFSGVNSSSRISAITTQP
ncbi:MAG: response regulator transcription factor [Candidatus Melainabacteria bacterium]|nr:response regulator transcription factor [Candidatus Melainabacteria bacterium]